jgi:hypothetical protein
MSVLDQFRDAERRVAERLSELEPAVTAYRELEDVARRLGLDLTTAQPAAASPATRRRRPRRTAAKTARKAPTPKRSAASAKTNGAPDARRRRAVAKPGERGAQLLSLVQQRPGITVAEAGKQLGVDPTGLYRVVKTLEQRRAAQERPGPRAERRRRQALTATARDGCRGGSTGRLRPALGSPMRRARRRTAARNDSVAALRPESRDGVSVY